MNKTIKIMTAVCAVTITLGLTGCNKEGSKPLFGESSTTSTSTGLPIDATHSDIPNASKPETSTSSSTTTSTISSTTPETSDTSGTSSTESSKPSGGGRPASSSSVLTKIPDTPVEELPLVPPIGVMFDDQAPLNIVMINAMPIDLLTANPKEFCQLAGNFYMQIDPNYVNTDKFENKAGFLFNGVSVAQGFNGSAPVYVETLDADGNLLTEWRLDTDPENPLPYDDYEIKGIHYAHSESRPLDIAFLGGVIRTGITREEVEETIGRGYEQHIEKKYTNEFTGEEFVEYTNLVYYKNIYMSMVLEYEENKGHERLMGVTLVKNIDKHDQ